MKDVMSTLTDVLDTLNDFATKTEGDIRDLKAGQARTDERLTRIEGDVGYLKSGMVTKSYLDDKLFDKESDSGTALRKEDQKIDAVVFKLEEKNIINKQEATAITTMSPFAVLPN